VDPISCRAALNSLPKQYRRALQLMLSGRSEKQIAEQMSISPHTLHTYVKTVYRRFGVGSRAQLLAALLVPSPEIFGAPPEKAVGILAGGGHTHVGSGAELN
jgi:N-acetylmuramic acid 6-phosphate (MurNAc-6-P) etherase